MDGWTGNGRRSRAMQIEGRSRGFGVAGAPPVQSRQPSAQFEASKTQTRRLIRAENFSPARVGHCCCATGDRNGAKSCERSQAAGQPAEQSRAELSRAEPSGSNCPQSRSLGISCLHLLASWSRLVGAQSASSQRRLATTNRPTKPWERTAAAARQLAGRPAG